MTRPDDRQTDDGQTGDRQTGDRRRDRRPTARGVAAATLAALVGLTLALGVAGRGVSQDLTEQEENAIKSAVGRVAPSVVRIETFGGLERVGQVLIGTGPTTGLIVAEDGFVVSSAFNFVQMPSSILVTLPDGTRKPAKIAARDHSRKLVLLKVETDSPLSVPEAVARQEMRVGQWAIAVGRTLSEDAPNVSVGILSARDRIWGKAIQTDAKISPSNYGGPLIDVRGRVLGILVPLSPQQQEEVAGAEWYDSGIGFAVPLEDVYARLDELEQGTDLMPGLLGISFKGKDIYDGAPTIGSVRVNSPAYECGLKAGDVVVQVDDMPVIRQAQIKHALGARYAGDKVRVNVRRDDEQLEFEAVLTDKLLPYFHPQLGILPVRQAAAEQEREQEPQEQELEQGKEAAEKVEPPGDDARDRLAGVAVRYVFPDSPASRAGLSPGDRIVGLGDKPLSGVDDLREAMMQLRPEAEVVVRYHHPGNGEPIEKKVVLAKMSGDVPESLDPVEPLGGEPDPNRPATGIVKIEIPEHALNKCVAYVPETYTGRAAHGLVVCLHGADRLEQSTWIERWKEHCERRQLILVAPQSAQERRWTPTDSEYIGKVVHDVLSHYNVDRSRIVVHGLQSGGAMAFLVAFEHRDLFRGVVAVDAGLPGRIRDPENDPVNRLAILFHVPKGSGSSARVAANSKSLNELGFPATTIESQGELDPPDKRQLTETVLWIDTLDRI